MTLHTELLTEKCIYCTNTTLRVKQRKDWKPGERISRGYHPQLGTYLYCTTCQQTQIMTPAASKDRGIKNIITSTESEDLP